MPRFAPARVMLALLLALCGLTACSNGPTTATPGGDYNYTPPPPRPDPTPLETPKPEKPEKPDTNGPVITRASILKKNDLYRSGRLSSGRCEGQSQVPLDNQAHLKQYYASVLKCLNRTWSKLGGRTDYRPAKLVMHRGNSVSECGAYTISFYCSSEDTIYMYVDEIVNPWRQFEGNAIAYRNIRLSAAHTIAHEYGHHVQNYAKMFLVLGDVRGTIEENRLELQASCLGEVFLSANKSRYPISASDLSQSQYWRYIQVPNHGSNENQKVWGDRGLASASPKSCNTWTAPKGKVS